MVRTRKALFPKLRAIPLFRELNRRDLEAVVQLIEIRTYSTGGVVFEQGTPGDGVYVVLKGCVEVIPKDGKDSEKVLLAESESGSFLVKPRFWTMRRERLRPWRQKIPNWHFSREMRYISWRNNDHIWG